MGVLFEFLSADEVDFDGKAVSVGVVRFDGDADGVALATVPVLDGSFFGVDSDGDDNV